MKEERKAVALKYDPETDRVPVIVATGEGDFADAIVEKAVASGVFVMRDSSLAAYLSCLDPGQVIPAELYQAAALIFSRLAALDAGGDT